QLLKLFAFKVIYIVIGFGRPPVNTFFLRGNQYFSLIWAKNVIIKSKGRLLLKRHKMTPIYYSIYRFAGFNGILEHKISICPFITDLGGIETAITHPVYVI